MFRSAITILVISNITLMANLSTTLADCSTSFIQKSMTAAGKMAGSTSYILAAAIHFAMVLSSCEGHSVLSPPLCLHTSVDVSGSVNPLMPVTRTGTCADNTITPTMTMSMANGENLDSSSSMKSLPRTELASGTHSLPISESLPDHGMSALKVSFDLAVTDVSATGTLSVIPSLSVGHVAKVHTSVPPIDVTAKDTTNVISEVSVLNTTTRAAALVAAASIKARMTKDSSPLVSRLGTVSDIPVLPTPTAISNSSVSNINTTSVEANMNTAVSLSRTAKNTTNVIPAISDLKMTTSAAVSIKTSMTRDSSPLLSRLGTVSDIAVLPTPTANSNSLVSNINTTSVEADRKSAVFMSRRIASGTQSTLITIGVDDLVTRNHHFVLTTQAATTRTSVVHTVNVTASQAAANTSVSTSRMTRQMYSKPPRIYVTNVVTMTSISITPTPTAARISTDDQLLPSKLRNTIGRHTPVPTIGLVTYNLSRPDTENVLVTHPVTVTPADIATIHSSSTCPTTSISSASPTAWMTPVLNTSLSTSTNVIVISVTIIVPVLLVTIIVLLLRWTRHRGGAVIQHDQKSEIVGCKPCACRRTDFDDVSLSSNNPPPTLENVCESSSRNPNVCETVQLHDLLKSKAHAQPLGREMDAYKIKLSPKEKQLDRMETAQQRCPQDTVVDISKEPETNVTKVNKSNKSQETVVHSSAEAESMYTGSLRRTGHTVKTTAWDGLLSPSAAAPSVDFAEKESYEDLKCEALEDTRSSEDDEEDNSPCSHSSNQDEGVNVTYPLADASDATLRQHIDQVVSEDCISLPAGIAQLDAEMKDQI